MTDPATTYEDLIDTLLTDGRIDRAAFDAVCDDADAVAALVADALAVDVIAR